LIDDDDGNGNGGDNDDGDDEDDDGEVTRMVMMSIEKDTLYLQPVNVND